MALPAAPPSLWLYVAVALAAALLAVAAFAIAGHADWPNLLLNVAAGLISALVVLIVVERRIRRTELAILMRTPARARFSVRLLFDPATRAAHNYARTTAAGLTPLIAHRAPLSRLDENEATLLSGANLLGAPGSGKTLWLMYVSAKLAQTFISSLGTSKLAVLVPLRRWTEDRSLEDEVVEQIQSVAACLRWTARRLITKHVRTVLFDGYDEIFMERQSFPAAIEVLSREYPGLAISVSSRPDVSSPLQGTRTITIPPYTDQEVLEIRARIMSRRSDA